MMITAAIAVLALAPPQSATQPAGLEEAAGWTLIMEDGVFQRRRGPLSLGENDTVLIWTAALPQPEHAATLGAVFQRFELDCPRHKIRRREGLVVESGATATTALNGGDESWGYPGSQPPWVARLLVDVCTVTD